MVSVVCIFLINICNKGLIQVIIYGNVTLDADELAILSLPPSLVTLPSIRKDDILFEGSLCSTKVRYGRMTTGGPAEMESERQEREEMVNPDLSMDEMAMKEEHRDIFYKDTQSINFTNLRVTDM